MKVLICDDQEVVRKGLEIILTHSPGIEVVGLAANGREALDMAAQQAPDIVLMDLKMPEMDGIEATGQLSQRYPTLKILVLTTFDADDWVFRALRAGAAGYLLKDSEGETIIEALHETMAGRTILDPQIAGKVLAEFRTMGKSPTNGEKKGKPADSKQSKETQIPALEPLTERELSILEEMATGKSNAEIAAALFLAEGTVKNNVSNIIQKMQANSRTQAILRGLRSGLVDL